MRDTVPGGDYLRDEDPSLFRSEKTGRGPLAESWRTDYVNAIAAGATDKAIMCAYKLCKVEFKYWGMQSKIERFIHDVGELPKIEKEMIISMVSISIGLFKEFSFSLSL